MALSLTSVEHLEGLFGAPDLHLGGPTHVHLVIAVLAKDVGRGWPGEGKQLRNDVGWGWPGGKGSSLGMMWDGGGLGEGKQLRNDVGRGWPGGREAA